MQTLSETPITPIVGLQAGDDEQLMRWLALTRATLYSALALGFRPPEVETMRGLVLPDAVEALADAARAFELMAEASGVRDCAVTLSQHRDLDELTTDHCRLFGHTARTDVPAYETEYGDEAVFQQPHELGDLAGFMQAFGLMVRPDAHERIDHVSCECEFVAFLASKEAYAREHRDEEMLAATTRATYLFLRDHLGRFAPTFGHQLRRADGEGFYGALGGLLVAVVTADCHRLGIPLGSEALGLRPDPALCTAPMGCSSGGCDAAGSGD